MDKDQIQGQKEFKKINWKNVAVGKRFEGKTSRQKLKIILDIATENKIEVNPKNLKKLLKDLKQNSAEGCTPLVDILMEKEVKVFPKELEAFLNLSCAAVFSMQGKSLFWGRPSDVFLEIMANASDKLEDFVEFEVSKGWDGDNITTNLLLDIAIHSKEIFQKLKIDRFREKECGKNEENLKRIRKAIQRNSEIGRVGSENDNHVTIDKLILRAEKWRRLKEEKNINITE